MNVDVLAEYGQRVADQRRRVYYRSVERADMAWFAVAAVLVGALVGAFVASGDAAQIGERLLQWAGV